MPLFEHISPQQRTLMAIVVPPASPLAFWPRFVVAVALCAVFVRYSTIFMLLASCLWSGPVSAEETPLIASEVVRGDERPRPEPQREYVDVRDWPALMTPDSEWREENGRFTLKMDDRNHHVKRIVITYADGTKGRCFGAIKGWIILFWGNLNGYGGIYVENGKLVMEIKEYVKPGEKESRVRMVSPQKPPEPRTDGT